MIKKVIYSMEQMVEITKFIDSLTLTGIKQCREITRIADIIDNPIDTINEEEGSTE